MGDDGQSADANAEQLQLAANFCVGRGANDAVDESFGDNAVAFGTFSVFDEGTWGSAVAQNTWDTSVRLDGALLTNPLTLTRTDVHGAAETYTTQVSNIQIEQIQQRIVLGATADLPDLVAGAGASNKLIMTIRFVSVTDLKLQ